MGNKRQDGPINGTDITIIIATYNRALFFRKALGVLVRQETGGKFSYDILVIDDGSTDSTRQVVQDVSNNAPGISIDYFYQENAGQCAALNTGVARAQGNWLTFFDDDQWAEPGWLTELYQTAQESQADCVGGAVSLDLPESLPFQPGPRLRRLLAEKSKKVKHVAVKDLIGSGNVLIRKSVFHRVGRFDRTFHRGYDTDFFWRLEKAGFRLCYNPQAIIYHVIHKIRLQPPYLRRLCCEIGFASARIRWQYEGYLGLALSNLWRLGVALGRDLPLLAIAGMAGHRPLVIDSLCSLWFTLSFMRTSLFFTAPRFFPQQKFLAQLGFAVHDRK